MAAVIVDGGRGHSGPHLRASGCSNARVASAVRTSSCCLLKGPATDPIQPNSRCHPPPAPPSPASPSHTHIHTCAPQTHAHKRRTTHTPHARTDECVSQRMGGTWNYLQRTKSKIKEKKMPLRINLTTMLRKIPNLTPETQEKPCFSLSGQSKVSYKGRNRKHFR